MKSLRPHLRTALIHSARIFAVVFAAHLASAANNDTWVGDTSINWNTAGNWNPVAVPAAGDSLFFGTAGTAGAGLTNDIAAGRSFAGITFNSGGSAFTLVGNNVTLTGGITNNSGVPQLINFSITNGANITINDAGGGMTLGGAILGAGAITNIGSGTVTLTNANGANTFTGGITVNNGKFQAVGNNGNSSLGKGNIVVNSGGTLIGTNGDAFGYFTSSARVNPTNIIIAGGTVSDLPGAYRITLPNLTFIGGLLTNDPGNTGNAGIEYAFNGNNSTESITSLVSTATAVIAATGIVIQRPTTFNIAAGNVIGGSTPGVDLLISSVLSGSKVVSKFGAGTLAFSGANTFTGGLTNNAGTVALLGSASLATTAIVITNGARFDVSQLTSGAFTLAASKTLAGNGVVTGNVEAASSSVIDAGMFGGSTFGFSNNLTLDGMTLNFKLSGTTNGANSKVAVAGNLTLNAPNTISVSGFSSLQSGTYPLITYGSETPNGQTWNLTGFVSNGRQAASIVDLGVSEVDLVVTGVVSNLKWVGDGIANNWDVTTTSNWFNLNTSQADEFFNGDLVTFDDTGSTNPAVNLATMLQPGALLVTNNTCSYVFSGGGFLNGLTSLVKQGTNTLLLQESGGDNFSGGISVSNGTVILDQPSANITGGITIASGAIAQIGTNDSGGFLPTGTLTDNGTLIFNRQDFIAANSVISGSGSIVQNGSGSVTLSAANTFSGNITVNNGTLTDSKIAASDGSNGGLGSSLAPGRTITVASNATLSATVQNWFGGSVPDANLPSLIIVAGIVNSSRYTTLGNVTLNDGATLTQSSTDPATYQGYQLRGSVTVGGLSASSISSGNNAENDLGSNTVFNVAVTSGSGPDLMVSTGFRNQSGDYSTAAGGFTKIGAGTMLLSAACTYTGNTVVSNGVLALDDSGSISTSANIIVAAGAKLDVSARTDDTLTLASGQTLSGSGTVLGGVTSDAGASIAPGTTDAVGSLTVTNAISLSGTVTMKLNAASSTNDVLTGAQSIAYGGTLTVTNIAGTLAANQTFQLFSAAGYSGAFAATNLPALSAGMIWSTTNLAVNGTITVVQSVNTNPTNIVFSVVGGTNLVLSWPADHTGWGLQVQTNTLAVGLEVNSNAWFNIPGSSGVNILTNPIVTTNGAVFYRMRYPPVVP